MPIANLGRRLLLEDDKYLARRPFSCSLVDTDFIATDGTSFTFSGLSFGALPGPYDTRYIVVMPRAVIDGTNTDFVVESLSVGGIKPVIPIIGQNNFTPAALMIAEPPGLTGDITVVYTQTMLGCAVAVYRLMNPASVMPDAMQNVSHSGGVCTISNLLVRPGGFVIASAQLRNNAASTLTWSALTSDFEQDVSADDLAEFFSGTPTSSPITFTVTCDDTTPQSFRAMAASWGP